MRRTLLHTGLLAVVLPSFACASTTATLYAVDGRWPMSSSTVTNEEWLEGLPTTDLVVEARLESPPRALCQSVRHEPPQRVTTDTYALDGVGRFLYGFFGDTEIGIAAALHFAGKEDDGGCIGCDVAGVYFALDGIAAIAMAFLIPDTHYQSVHIRPPQNVASSACPPNVAFEVAGRAFPVDPNGMLAPDHADSLMNATVETGSAIALRFGGDQVRWSTVPPELRCAWAVELGHQLAPSLCPRVAPAMRRPPPMIVAPIRPPPPPDAAPGPP
jgi:hypothetical protein